MKILHKPGSIQAATEDENRDADLAQIASMVDFLCILADVPTEDEATNTEEQWVRITVQPLTRQRKSTRQAGGLRPCSKFWCSASPSA